MMLPTQLLLVCYCPPYLLEQVGSETKESFSDFLSSFKVALELVSFPDLSSSYLALYIRESSSPLACVHQIQAYYFYAHTKYAHIIYIYKR